MVRWGGEKTNLLQHFDNFNDIYTGKKSSERLNNKKNFQTDRHKVR